MPEPSLSNKHALRDTSQPPELEKCQTMLHYCAFKQKAEKGGITEPVFQRGLLEQPKQGDGTLSYVLPMAYMLICSSDFFTVFVWPWMMMMTA